MDNIYDTLAKLDKVANAPEIVKEDSQALMKKGLKDLMKKQSLINKLITSHLAKATKIMKLDCQKMLRRTKCLTT